MDWNGFFHGFRRWLGLCLAAAALSGCATMPGWLPTSGASRQQVRGAESSDAIEGIVIVNVDDTLTRKLAAGYKNDSFSEVFGTAAPSSYRIGTGDVIEISIWEASPAMLFGSIALGVGTTKNTQAEVLPPQMVMEDGNVNVPFAGRIHVDGRTVREIESDIANRLHGQANQPQVVVRVTQNNTSNVTMLGDIRTSAQVPLTPRGERLLDAIAQAGGVAQPVTSVSVRLSREATTAMMPLDSIIRYPEENIALMPGDVITALFQPKMFSVFGAVGSNKEVPFEVQGISLAQALARSGGLNDSRADARGVFVFRFENAALVGDGQAPPASADGTTPVIYQIDLRDPASFFVAQNFPIMDRDLIYVANAPTAELEKFLRLIGSVLSPGMSTTNFVQNLNN